jgi:hypothetical protein
LGAVRQLACSVGDTLKIKDLNWLPKRNTNPNTLVESPAGPQFSTLLTEAEDVESKDDQSTFNYQ